MTAKLLETTREICARLGLGVPDRGDLLMLAELVRNRVGDTEIERYASGGDRRPWALYLETVATVRARQPDWTPVAWREWCAGVQIDPATACDSRDLLALCMEVTDLSGRTRQITRLRQAAGDDWIEVAPRVSLAEQLGEEWWEV
ncbi:MAG: hypothetical protein ACREE4_20975 [Stellaceae bacterium]